MLSKHQLKYYQQLVGAQVIRRPIWVDHSPRHRLPHYIDLREWMTPVVDQQDLNTCSAVAFSSACEYLLKRHTGQDIQISQLFIYFNARFMDQGTYTLQDEGASRRSVVNSMHKFGICKEEDWPFKTRYLNKKPPDHVYAEAKRYNIVSNQIPLNITAIRKSLAKQIPTIVGIKIQDGVYNEASVNGGYLSIPDPNDMEIAYTGTHAVLIVGYDDASQHFIVRNSWGSHWGDGGYFYMPYEYLLDERLANYTDGAWTITHITRRSNYSLIERQLAVPRYRHNPRRYYRP